MEVHIPKEAFNQVFYPYLWDEEHRYLVFYGGAGSGKSVFAAQRFLCRLLSKPLCNLLVVRAVAATHRDSTLALFQQLIARWGLQGLFTCRQSDLRITCQNGNQVIFKGMDDPEKLKSVTFPKGELTDVWVEEASEITREGFLQLDARLRGRGAHKQMVLTFNPVWSHHWLKARFFDRPDPRAAVVKSTYRDNRFLDEDYRRTLEGYRDTDPYYYGVYCLGEWGVLGQSVFDAANVARRLGELPAPLREGEFAWETRFSPQANEVLLAPETVAWANLPGGPVRIYQEPQPGRTYVVGADTAGEGSDFSVAQVVCQETGEQAATLRGRLDEDVFARQLYCLGRFYHTALVAVEANFSSYPIRELERLGYPRLYARPGGGRGFVTNSRTRPLMLAGLVEVVRDHPGWLWDRDTLRELQTFVRGPRGRPQAQAGAHDDCVMSLAIAHYVRSQRAGEGEGDASFAVVARREGGEDAWTSGP